MIEIVLFIGVYVVLMIIAMRAALKVGPWQSRVKPQPYGPPNRWVTTKQIEAALDAQDTEMSMSDPHLYKIQIVGPDGQVLASEPISGNKIASEALNGDTDPFADSEDLTVPEVVVRACQEAALSIF